MDRNEAMLRELNLYPQWTLRTPVQQVAIAEIPQPLLSVSVASIKPVLDAPAVPLAAVLNEVASDAQNQLNQVTQVNPLGAQIITAAASPVADEHAPFSPASTWSALKTQVRDCQRCGLRAGCAQTVFGGGDEQADWLFVGDMPRDEEALQNEAFTGEAGLLLDNMLAAMQLAQGTNVYIANVVKCRPVAEQHPAAAETAQCLPYLQRQIELVQPKVIVALGKVAAANLLGEEGALDELRGVLHDYQGIPVIVTYHPAYLLRKPTAKAQAWQDLCFALDVMSEA
jgi:uracil-DNA glycosylase